MAYYLSKQFRQNQIFDLLQAGDFTRVVSVDMGRGWTRAWLYEQGEDGWTGTALKLDEQGNTCIPTRINYDEDDDGFAFVGYEVGPENSLQRFKTPPQDWDKLSPDGKHTFKGLMRDFINSLWWEIRAQNRDKGVRKGGKDQLLLVVGCPFAAAWTGTDDVRQLIRDATDHDHVVVVPESFAAMTRAAHGEQLELSAGVVLFDIGAVTTDFLYVQQGKKLMARSLEWGGDRLDRALLDEMLKDNGLSRRAVPLSHLADVLDQVRQIKEDFYLEQVPLERALTMQGAGEGGQDRKIPVAMDQTLMDKALAPLLPELERFFRQMKERIGSRPRKTVFLAGGASQTPKVLGLAQQVFGSGCQVRLLEDPANCVVQGLALTVCGWFRAGERSETYRSQIEGYLAARFDGFRLHCSDVVLSSFFSAAPQQLQRVQQSGKLLRLSQITAIIEKAVKAVGLPKEQKLGWHLEDVSGELVHDGFILAEELTGDLSRVPIKEDAEVFSKDTQALVNNIKEELARKRNKVDLNALMAQILGQTDFKKLFFFSCIDDDFLKRHRSRIYRMARSATSVMFPTLPPTTDSDTYSLEEWRATGAFQSYPELMSEQMLRRTLWDLDKNLHRAQDYINLEKKDPVMDKKTMDKAMKWLQSEYWVRDGWERTHMELVLDKCPMLREIYDTLFRDLYEVLLGKVLLLVFDERADIP